MMKKYLYVLIIILLAQVTVLAKNPIIYFGYGKNSIKVVDAMTFQELATISVDFAPGIIEISKDRKFAFGYGPFNPAGILVIDLDTQTQIMVLNQGQRVYRVKQGPDGNIYACINNGDIYVYDPTSLKVISIFHVPTGAIGIAWGKNGLVFLPDINQNCYVVDTNNGFAQVQPPIQLPAQGFLDGESIEISPSGDFLYISRNDGLGPNGTVVIPTADPSAVTPLSMIPGAGFISIVKPNSQYLYDQSNDLSHGSFMNIYSMIDNTLLSRVIFLPLIAARFNSDGSFLYAEEHGNGIILYDTRDTIKLPALITLPYPDLQGLAIVGDFPSPIPPPNIAIAAPMAGTTVQKGAPFTINWQSSPGGFKIKSQKIEISLDGGKTYSPLASNLDGDTNHYNWNVPANAVNSAMVRITATDILGLTSTKDSGSFAIGTGQTGDHQAPSVKLLNPAGGEHFNNGDTINISWTSTDNVGVTAQDLSLSTDGGQTFPVSIVSGLAGNVQSFSYTLPANIVTNNGRLKLTARDAAGNAADAVTANDFTVAAAVDTQPPTITIIAPTSSSLLSAGQPIVVNWQSSDNVAVTQQALLLSLDGGNSFQSLATFDGSASSFTINNVAGLDQTVARAAVKITAQDGAGNLASASVEFAIAPAITAANYNKPTLTINGIGFGSANSSMIAVTINGHQIDSSKIKSSSNTTLVLQGNRKKLGLIKGTNIVTVTVNGVASNSSNFNF